ncbi:MAG: type IV secretion system DNA-binding domain-containing protein [Candidatus Falkowbacteria bacterium]
MANEITVFAETTFRNQYRKFGIKEDDRRRHMYVIGKSGVGKSTLLENMIMEDIRAGRGVAVADPHGELAEKIIQYIPDNRIDDVIFFNPADTEFPIAFNILEQVAPEFRHLVSSGLIGVFQKLWADSWGPRLEYILRNAILAVLDYPGSTLLSVTRMLSDKTFRKKVVDNIQDPVVKQFWVKEFAGYQDKFASEAVAPIQNKVGQFLSSSLIRNVVGQVRSSIDIRKIMDEKKILLMDLSKGRIGEDNSQLLGAMMITKIQLAAMSRVDIAEKERNDFYLYVDEFQNFATESFANILSEARKYRLALIMAHQYIEQLNEKVKSAVFGNVGTLVVYRVGATDASSLVKEFAPVFTEEDLVNLPKYNLCIKLMIDGIASDPFSARCLPPLPEGAKTGNAQKVIDATRAKFASPRLEVEEAIAKWHMDEPAPKREDRPAGAAAPVAAAGDRPERPAYNDRPTLSNGGFKAECASCNKEVILGFEPDGVRPVFCKNCLAKSKEERAREVEERKKRKSAELATVTMPATPAPATLTAPARSAPAPHAAPVRTAPANHTPTARPTTAHTAPAAKIFAKPAARPQATVRPAAKPQPELVKPVLPKEEIGLGDLLGRAPVDFRGRTIDTSKEPVKAEETEEGSDE